MWGWIACAAIVLTNALILGVWKPFFASYATEKGKQLATREDIDNVVQQVRAVTRETESIKTDISSGAWMKQWRLAQQRDAYVAYIAALTAHGIAWNALSEVDPKDSAGIDAGRQKFNETSNEFLRAQAVVTIFCGSNVKAANEEIHNRMQLVGGAAVNAPDSGNSLPPIDDVALLTTIVNAARDDLGIPPIGGPGERTSAPSK